MTSTRKPEDIVMTRTDEGNGDTVESDTDVEENEQIVGNSNGTETSDGDNDTQGREIDGRDWEKVSM